MPILTKSIYEPEDPNDGMRVLVTRFYPRGVKKDRFDTWQRALAPSRELLLGYRRGSLDWKEFVTKFTEELYSSPESLAAIDSLAERSRTQNVTLLCFEKGGELCHRHVVEAIVKRTSTSTERNRDPTTKKTADQASPSRKKHRSHHAASTLSR